MLLPVVLFASFALIQQVPAQDPAPPQSQPESEAVTLAPVTVTRSAPEPAQTCRTEAVTGSRFGRRVCRSTAQSAEDRAASREMLRQMQGGSHVPPSG